MKFFSTVGIMGALSLSMLAIVDGLAFSGPEARPIAAANDVQPFAGIWTATRDGIRIVELVLRAEKGSLAAPFESALLRSIPKARGK
jgi:hypothetical protein